MESLRYNLSQLTNFGRLFFLIFSCLLAWLVSTIILWLSVPLFFDISIPHIPYYLAYPHEADSASFLLYLQGGSSAGLFIGGALIYSYFAERGQSVWFNFTAQHSRYNLILVGIGVIALLGLLPMVDALERLNKMLVFPESMSELSVYFERMQSQMDSVIARLTSVDTPGDIAFVVVVMAVIPAIGEEWIFRAKLQGILQRLTGSAHGGIWLTSLAFTIMHQQIFAVLPMMLLALFLGYLYAYTRSLWMTVTAHFVNNLTSLIVLMKFPDAFHQQDFLPSWMYAGSAFLLLGAIVLLIFQWKKLGIHQIIPSAQS